MIEVLVYRNEYQTQNSKEPTEKLYKFYFYIDIQLYILWGIVWYIYIICNDESRIIRAFITSNVCHFSVIRTFKIFSSI
jgi:hypothetical protein